MTNDGVSPLALREIFGANVPNTTAGGRDQLFDQHLQRTRNAHQHRKSGIGRTRLEVGQGGAGNASDPSQLGLTQLPCRTQLADVEREV